MPDDRTARETSRQRPAAPVDDVEAEPSPEGPERITLACGHLHEVPAGGWSTTALGRQPKKCVRCARGESAQRLTSAVQGLASFVQTIAPLVGGQARTMTARVTDDEREAVDVPLPRVIRDDDGNGSVKLGPYVMTPAAARELADDLDERADAAEQPRKRRKRT